MKSKKADVSINTIVYLAIAVLVLVLIVMYVTGMFAKIGGGLKETAPQELETIKNSCTVSCNGAMSAVETSDVNAWDNSDYCTRARSYDKDRDGTKDLLNCWDDPINVKCKTTVALPAPEDVLDNEGKPTGVKNAVWVCSIYTGQYVKGVSGCTCVKKSSAA